MSTEDLIRLNRLIAELDAMGAWGLAESFRKIATGAK